MTLDVLDGGLLTTIQDGGRADHGHLGVPESGAADPISFAIANRLVGNEPGAAVLEMTLVGGAYRADGPVAISLAGAELGARVRGGRRLSAGRSHRLAAGEILDVPGDTSTGCRLYVAIEGGFDVPVVLDSRSTCLTGAFGGLDGRAVRAGDRLTAFARRDAHAPRQAPDRAWPVPAGLPSAVHDSPPALRVLPVDAAALDALAARPWRVGVADRVGTRLEPADDQPPATGLGGEILTHGMPWGAVQVPPDGRPIVLGPDHGTTGGYRVVGVVITADRPVLGQLTPGGKVRLVPTDRDAAIGALRAQRETLAAGFAELRASAQWDALAGEAGG